MEKSKLDFGLTTCFNLTAEILSIGAVEVYKREGKPDLKKRNISLQTSDGQKLFCEIRPNNFEISEYLRKGHKISVGYIFAGSERQGKQYNNIIIETIEVIS